MDNDVAKAVEAVYSLFCRGFSRPAGNLFFKDYNAMLPLLTELIPEAREYLNNVARFGEETDEEERNRLYSSLFLTGAYGKTLSPCESVYLSDEGLIMQDQRDEVLHEYVEHKMGLAPSFNEPEDHIAAELSFAAALAGDGKTRSAFLKNHPLKWIHLFEKDISLLCGGFYLDLTRSIRIFMEFDAEVLSV